MFYYCPAHEGRRYSSTANGWPTFFAKDASDPMFPRWGQTWAGYAYACPVPPGHSPLDDGKLTYKRNPGLDDPRTAFAGLCAINADKRRNIVTIECDLEASL